MLVLVEKGAYLYGAFPDEHSKMKVCTTLQGEESLGGFHDSMSSLGPVAFTCKSRTRPGAGMKSKGSGLKCG